eukprot:1161398-Pelagomonas_calceolata.AAC.3
MHPTALYLDEVPTAQDGAWRCQTRIDREHVSRQVRHAQLHPQLPRRHAHRQLPGVDAILGAARRKHAASARTLWLECGGASSPRYPQCHNASGACNKRQAAWFQPGKGTIITHTHLRLHHHVDRGLRGRAQAEAVVAEEGVHPRLLSTGHAAIAVGATTLQGCTCVRKGVRNRPPPVQEEEPARKPLSCP